MKKKGFTLIELLAVLVVLAIIALITIPIVLGIINRARIKSEEASVRGYADALEKSYSTWLIDNPNGTFNDFDYSNVEYKGNRVTCDKVGYSGGNIELNCCYVGNNENNYYSYKNNTVRHYNVCPSKREYHVGDTFTLNGDSYHIIADSLSADDYVVALKDNPLTVSELESAGATDVYDISYWDEQTEQNVSTGYGRIVYHETSNVYATSNVKSVVDAWATSKFTNGELKIVDGYSVRLIKFDEAHIFGYGDEPQSPCGSSCGVIYYPPTELTPSWVYNLNYGYWTMSSVGDSASSVWCVSGDGGLTNSGVSNDDAVRPVINVKKSALTSS